MSTINTWLHQLFDGRCRFCHIPCSKQDICAACKEDLPWITAACYACGLPLASGAVYCADCLSSPPPFTHTIAIWRYSDDIQRLIQAYKFEEDFAAGRLLAELAAKTLQQRQSLLDAPVIPMPIHPKRRRSRGFDHTHHLAKWIGLSISYRLLKRQRHTPPQSGLDAAARAKNLAQAFTLTATPPPQVILFDDVLTTGASTREAAATLKAAGVKRVECFVLARAI